MDNKYITIALIAAICVSLGGTFITLNKLSELSETQVTGFAVSDTGQGRILIAKQVAIVVNASVGPGGSANFHNDVYFGSCKPDTVNEAAYLLTSNMSKSAQGPGNCTGDEFPDYIHVYNTGNVDANITIMTNINRTNFIVSGNNDALFGYKTTDGDLGPNNGTHRGGCRQCQNTAVCAGTAAANVTNWVQFNNQTNMKYLACQNLTYASSGPKPGFKTYLMTQVPLTAVSTTAATEATLTYTGSEIS